MKLEDLPEVAGIDADGFYKFMIFVVTDDNDVSRAVLRAIYLGTQGEIYRQHYEVANLLYDEVKKSLRLEELGGGMLESRGNNVEIDVFAASYDYGPEPEREMTIEMLRRSYPKSEVRDTT